MRLDGNKNRHHGKQSEAIAYLQDLRAVPEPGEASIPAIRVRAPQQQGGNLVGIHAARSLEANPTAAQMDACEGSGALRPVGSPRRTRSLSAANVELALGLPRGAWKSRRLFALQVRSETYRNCQIHRGDHLIVEPGAQASPNRLVVVRDGSALALRRVRLDATGRCVLSLFDPDALPFAVHAPAQREHVIGRVVAILPAARASALPADPACGDLVRIATTQDGLPRSAAGLAAARRAPAGRKDIRSREELALVDAWSRWVEDRARGAGPEESVFLYDLACQLRTLHACMVTTGDKQLYGALVAEARSVLRDLRRRVEIVRAARPGARRYRAA